MSVKKKLIRLGDKIDTGILATKRTLGLVPTKPKTLESAVGQRAKAKADTAMGKGGLATAGGLTATVLGVAGAIPTSGASLALLAPASAAGMYAREKRMEAVGERNKGRAIADLARRGKGLPNVPEQDVAPSPVPGAQSLLDRAKNFHKAAKQGWADVAAAGGRKGYAQQGRLNAAQQQHYARERDNYNASHMANAASDEPEQVSQVGAGKRGWANPKVQAAAQRAKGNKYEGPSE